MIFKNRILSGDGLSKILVTGHKSFVGQHLIPYLYEQGHEIHGVGRAGKLNGLSKQNEYLSGEILGDLSDTSIFNSLNWDPDVIINLAASTGKRETSYYEMQKNNVKTVKNLLKFAEKSNCNKIIQFSTVSVHGNVPGPVISHSTGIFQQNNYGVTKLESENILSNSLSSISIFSLRFPAILAKGAEDHWPSKVLSAAINGQNILVDNPNSQFNNVVHMTDICKFISTLLFNRSSGFLAFPLASKSAISIEEVVNQIIRISNSSSRIEFRNVPRPTFVIDDTFARINYNYDSLSTLDAVSRYVSDEMSG